MKVDRGLIIRREGVKLSEEYAQTCIESCEKHGFPYEIIDAVQFLPPKEAYASVGVEMNDKMQPWEGNACCHSSHIKCWKRIIELDRACVIMEHDAYVVGDPTTIEIPDDELIVTTFGFRIGDPSNYVPPRPADSLVKIKRSIGVHACGLTPKTARWLLDDVMKNGVRQGLDQWLMMGPSSGLPLYVVEPPQIVCWQRRSTMGIMSYATQNGLGVNSPINYNDSLTPGWKAGLKK